MAKKSQSKNLNILRTKRTLKVKKKSFPIQILTLQQPTFLQCKSKAHSEPCQTSKKDFKCLKLFLQNLHLRCMTGFWMRLYIRGGSRTAATSKMELFVIIVNGFQPLTIITKCSILDVAAVLGPPLYMPPGLAA